MDGGFILLAAATAAFLVTPKLNLSFPANVVGGIMVKKTVYYGAAIQPIKK